MESHFFILLVSECNDGLDDYGMIAFWVIYLSGIALILAVLKLVVRILQALFKRMYP